MSREHANDAGLLQTKRRFIKINGLFVREIRNGSPSDKEMENQEDLPGGKRYSVLVSIDARYLDLSSHVVG